MNKVFAKYEIEVLKAFSLQGYFGEIDFDRKITDTGFYLNFMTSDCYDEFNESDLTALDGEVFIQSSCLENGAAFMLYKANSSECIFSIEGYTYGEPWLSLDCDFKVSYSK